MVGRGAVLVRRQGAGGRPGAVGRGSLCPLLRTLLAGAPAARAPSETRPQIRRGDPLNLSILVSGGKETNQDSLSNGVLTAGQRPLVLLTPKVYSQMLYDF